METTLTIQEATRLIVYVEMLLDNDLGDTGKLTLKKLLAKLEKDIVSYSKSN